MKNNTAEVEQGDLSEANGDKILRAPPVDLALYTKLATAAVGCGATGTTCDTVITILVKYFKDAAAQVSGDLADWLQLRVQGAFEAALNPAAAVVNGATAPLAAVQQQLAACPATTAASARAAVADYQQALVAVQQQVDDAKQLQEKVTTAVAAVQGMAEALGQSYEQHLATAAADIMQGDLDFLDTVNFIGQSPDVVAALQDAQAFAQSAPTLQRDLEALSAAATKAQQAIAAMQTGPFGLPTGPFGGTSGTGCNVDASGLAVGDLATTAGAAVERAQAQLARLDPTAVQAGVATINRHFEVSADLPCLTTGTCEIGPPDIAVEVDCPQIYVCTAEVTVPMPNEHQPYLRIKGGNAAV